MPADENRGTGGLSDEEVATLGSLEQVDGYPLYAMHYYGAYEETAASAEVVEWRVNATIPNPARAASPPSFPSPSLSLSVSPWACSLFAALGDADSMLYGRNFDWEYSPAVLLFADPPDGYASASMVDIAYLGFGGNAAHGLTDLPLVERTGLLRAPFLPFDGFNERGLAVGMAAVPPGNMRPDPDKETIGSLMIIREVLDHAGDVGEAVTLFQSYNIDMGGGPPVHYLVADSAGRAALVEFYRGEMVVTFNETDWHLATNFLRTSVGESAEGKCWRYDRISQCLTQAQGRLTPQGAVDLLAEVAQGNTQWSIVYGMSTGEINVAMGREYDDVHTLYLGLADE